MNDREAMPNVEPTYPAQVQAVYHGDQVVEFVNCYSKAEIDQYRRELRLAHPAATIRVVA